VCNHLGLESAETIVIPSRGWSETLTNTDVQVLKLPKLSGIRIRIDIASLLKSIRKFDSKIAEATGGEKFRLYIPHSFVPAWQLLATHDLCVGFDYIEEGSADYCKRYEYSYLLKGDVYDKPIKDGFVPSGVVSTYRDGLRRRGLDKYLPKLLFRFSEQLLLKRIGHTAPFDEKAECAYALFHDSFKFVPVKAVAIKPIFESFSDASGYDGSVLFTPMPVYAESFAQKGMFSLETHIKVLRDVSGILADSGKRVLIKFHPDESEDARQQVIDKIFAPFNMTFEMVPDHLPVEYILGCSAVDLLHCMSSLGIYASKLGRRVYNYAPLICETQVDFSKKFASFKDNIVSNYDELDVRLLSRH
jgi:hypothetical protein